MARYRPLAAALNRPIRVAVLISGGGTTLANLGTKISDKALDAEISLVIASRPDCGGIARAAGMGLRCEVILRKSFPSVNEFSAAIFSQCRQAKVDLVICGGFLALLTICRGMRSVARGHPNVRLRQFRNRRLASVFRWQRLLTFNGRSSSHKSDRSHKSHVIQQSQTITVLAAWANYVGCCDQDSLASELRLIRHQLPPAGWSTASAGSRIGSASPIQTEKLWNSVAS